MAYIFWFALGDALSEPLVIISFALSAAIIALSFMFSEFLSFPAIKAYGKSELRELGVTIIIFLIIIGLSATGGAYDMIAKDFSPSVQPGGTPKVCDTWLAAHPYDAPSGYFGNNGNYAFGTAGYFIGCRFGFGGMLNVMTAGKSADMAPGSVQGVLMPELLGFYGEFMSYEIMTGLASTFSLGLQLPPALQSEFPVELSVNGIIPFIFLNPINEAHTLLVDVIGALISATAAQNMLLEFVEVNVPLVVLPIGILLRAFPFSRKAGSTVIAFAFVAYFIYPLAILLNQKIYTEVTVTPCPPNSNLKPDGSQCSMDAECCSQNCVGGAVGSIFTTGGKCYPQLGDFRKFQSTFGYAQKALDVSQIDAAEQQYIEGQLKADQDKELAYQQKVDSLGGPSSPSTKPASRTRDELIALQASKTKALNDRMTGGDMSVFMSPTTAFSMMGMYELYISEAGRLLVLISIFIVTEILLVFTLLKDISILIGGEPKIMGMGKLV